MTSFLIHTTLGKILAPDKRHTGRGEEQIGPVDSHGPLMGHPILCPEQLERVILEFVQLSPQRSTVSSVGSVLMGYLLPLIFAAGLHNQGVCPGRLSALSGPV